jgi:hypothetical protein
MSASDPVETGRDRAALTRQAGIGKLSFIRGPRAATFPHQHAPVQVRHVHPARLSSGDPLALLAELTASDTRVRAR